MFLYSETASAAATQQFAQGIVLKALTLIFVILIALLQYPLWLGKGSWLRVWNVNQKIEEQKVKNEAAKQRNETIGAEVHDLKQGNAAIEERARSELGMVKQDEVFYQVIDQPIVIQPSVTQSGAPAETGAASKPQNKPKTSDLKANQKPASNAKPAIDSKLTTDSKPIPKPE